MSAAMDNMIDESERAAIRNLIRLDIDGERGEKIRKDLEAERVNQARRNIQKKKREEINKRGFRIKGHTLNTSKFPVSASEIEDQLRRVPPVSISDILYRLKRLPKVSNSEIANRIGLQTRRAALARAKANPSVMSYAYPPAKHTTPRIPSKLSKGRKTRKGPRNQ